MTLNTGRSTGLCHPPVPRADRIINELMGKDASARSNFIMERAEEADELDV